jgi:hypothetical protein
MPKNNVSRASSGVTTQSTTNDDVLTLISHDDIPAGATAVRVVNEGGIAGYVSLDNAGCWERLPADQVITYFYASRATVHSVQVKRIPSGTQMTGLSASAW